MRPAVLLAAALAALLAPGLSAAAGPGTVSLAVTGETGMEGISPETVAARLASYVNGWYAGILEVTTRGAQADVRVSLAPSAAGLSLRTEMVRGAARTSRTTTLPRGAVSSLIPAAACDMVSLWSASEGFANLPLSAPPPLAASLSTDTLDGLTGWNAEDLEPLGVAGDDGRVTVAFPRGWLTLGPLFAVTADTARGLLAQGFAREPLLLSGVVQTAADGMALLSEREAKIAWVDTRLGTRVVRDAPNLPAGHAQRFGRGAVCALAAGAVSLWRSDGSPPRRIGEDAGLASAFTADAEGNLWVYDAWQARIRVLTPQGLEVFTVRPVARGAALQFPQQIAVFDDGSFLLGGAGEVWKFRNTGIPVWRLDRIPGTVAEALPSTFQVAVDRRSGGFVLLDAPSRRLLAFAADSGTPAPGNAPAAATGDGLLLTLQEAARAERRGEGSASHRAARLALLRKKAALFADLAAAFRGELLHDQAERALLKTAEAAREVLAEDPADAETARLLEQTATARREVRDTLGQGTAAVVSRARAVEQPGPRGWHLAVQLWVRNPGPSALSRLRASVMAPGLSLIPSLVETGTLQSGQEKRLELSLPLANPFEPVGPTVHAAVLTAWERGSEGGTTAERLIIEVVPPGQAEAAAALRSRLLLSIDPDDPVVRAVTAELAAGVEDGFAAAGAALDALGRMRQPWTGATGDRAFGPLDARRALRALSAEPLDWTLLVADMLSALRFPVGILAWPDAAVVVADTGVPLEEALAAVPALARDAALLGMLSRSGRLCVPLSGTPLPSPSSMTASVFALHAGLQACRERGVQAVAWLADRAPAAARAPVASPFPARFPVVTERLDRDTLAARIQSALEQKR